MAWVATVPWLWLAMRPGTLPGRRPYLQLWIVGSLFWMAILEGVRLPHPILYLGWLALSGYLGAYLPAFVGLVRFAASQGSAWWIAPAAWAGLEWVRSWLVGCSLCQLAHSQVEWPRLIQVSDLAGGYGLSFLMVLFGALLVRGLLAAKTTQRWPWLCAATAVICLVAGYGRWALHRWETLQQQSTPVRFLLIQGAKDVFYESDPQKLRAILQELWQLTSAALKEHPDTAVVVWPESAFAAGGGDLVVDHWDLVQPLDPADKDVEAYRSALRHQQSVYARNLEHMLLDVQAAAGIEPPHVAFIIGADTVRLGVAKALDRMQRFNAALLVSPQGKIQQRYFKMHRVMFGEYIPIVDWFPKLYGLTPMPAGLTPGDRPTAFPLGDLTLAPSICFESTVPSVIRGHLRRLAAAGQPAEVLVNITNDGWFGNSTLLDHHFACAVFRAVENRKPMAISANNGITAWISGAGRIEGRAPRRTPSFLAANLFPLAQCSSYYYLGDWPVMLGLLAAVAPSLVRRRWRGIGSGEASLSASTPGR